MAGIKDNKKKEIRTMSEFITTQAIDLDCHTTLVSGVKPNSRFNNDTDGVLVRVFSLDGASN